MKLGMKRLISVAGVCAAVATMVALTPREVSAKPANAANTGSGLGCSVADADGNYTFDDSCSWHTVVKFDRSGNLQIFNYQDHGTLPAGAPHPATTRRNAVSVNLGLGRFCTGTEVTTPSGQYTSNCHF